MHRFGIAKRVWFALFFLFCALYFYGLAAIPLVGPDEPRYAQVAREMLQRSDFITPTLGGHTWFEKPALLYWMMMAAYKLFGVSEFSARLGPAICGVLTALIVLCLAQKVTAIQEEDDAGFGLLAGLITISSCGLIAFSRGASFDITVTMTLAASLACFLLWDLEERTALRRLFLAGFYAAIGLSLLAKGLIGFVIPFGVVGLYYLLRRRWPSRELWISLLWGLPLSVAVSAIWYGPVIERNGWGFIQQFFIEHHFARYVSNKYHHPQPFYYYALIIWLLVLPWAIVLFRAIARKALWTSRIDNSAMGRLELFAAAWLIFPIAFFSISGSKLPGYILPVVPGAALLCALQIRRCIKSNMNCMELRLTGLIILCIGVGAAFYLGKTGVGSPVQIATLLVGAVAMGGAVFLRERGIEFKISMIVMATGMMIVFALNGVAGRIVEHESVKGLIMKANSKGYGSAPLVQMHTIERTSEFYAADRLRRGSDGEVLKLEGTRDVLDAARQQAGPILVLVPAEYESQLTQNQQLESHVIGNNGEFALMAVKAN